MRCKLIICIVAAVTSLLTACDDAGKEEPAGTLTSPDGRHILWITIQHNGINNSIARGYLTLASNNPKPTNLIFRTPDCVSTYATWSSGNEVIIFYDRIYISGFHSEDKDLKLKINLYNREKLPQNITSNGNVLKLPCTVWK